MFWKQLSNDNSNTGLVNVQSFTYEVRLYKPFQEVRFLYFHAKFSWGQLSFVITELEVQ